ncbi:MAG: hypothetical protein ACLFTT_02315 [Candidatus Hydrogenedentota bacterium]
MADRNRAGYQILRGCFSDRVFTRYLIAKAAVFWSLIALAWWAYPAENQYSIWTHTFSFLGSFETRHSPGWWWIFSVAMFFWGVATVPVAVHLGRRFAAVWRWGAVVGVVFLLAGCMGVVGVALVPDAGATLLGALRYTEVHEKAAMLTALGFTLANLWFAVLLIADALRGRVFAGRCGYWRFVLPYLFWGGVTGLGIFFQVRWSMRYAAMREAAQAAGRPIGSSWAESLGTIDAFPLWENLLIYALYIFLIWFALAVGGVRREGRG